MALMTQSLTHDHAEATTLGVFCALSTLILTASHLVGVNLFLPEFLVPTLCIAVLLTLFIE